MAERRPAKGLLGGMLGLFGTPWTVSAEESAGDGGSEGAGTEPDDEGAPCFAQWRDAGEIEHVFAHFRLRLRVRVGRTAAEKSSDAGEWIEPGEISTEAFPSIFAKAVRAALQADKESSSSQGGGPA